MLPDWDVPALGCSWIWMPWLWVAPGLGCSSPGALTPAWNAEASPGSGERGIIPGIPVLAKSRWDGDALLRPRLSQGIRDTALGCSHWESQSLGCSCSSSSNHLNFPSASQLESLPFPGGKRSSFLPGFAPVGVDTELLQDHLQDKGMAGKNSGKALRQSSGKGFATKLVLLEQGPKAGFPLVFHCSIPLLLTPTPELEPALLAPGSQNPDSRRSK